MNKLTNPLRFATFWQSLPLHRISGSDACLFLGGLLWVLSLTQVVFYTTHGVVMGFWVLISGWMGFVLFQFAWYANLLALLSVMLMARHPNRAMALAIMSILLAGQAFWFEDIPGQAVPMHVVRLGMGFGLWYVSLLLLALGVIFGADGRQLWRRQAD